MRTSTRRILPAVAVGALALGTAADVFQIGPALTGMGLFGALVMALVGLGVRTRANRPM